MYQSTTLIGHIGNQPEMRYLQNGTPVTSFSLATNKTWTDTNGEKKEKTTWWRVTCWRKLAETVSQYCTKGQRIMVVGDDVELRAYTSKSGEMASSLEITAVTVKFLSSKNESGESSTNGASQPAVTAPVAATDEIPW